MSAGVLDVAVAAVAMATETRAGGSDPAVLDMILDSLPDETVFAFIACLRVYQERYDRCGPQALREAGLQHARRACGLDP